jgi:large repetitive protein
MGCGSVFERLLSMALNAWQKISRVLPGRPFGNGSTDLTISSNTTQSLTATTAIASINSTSLTAGSTAFANNDVVVIHQARGTGFGQWEINMVASGGGTTSLTLKEQTKYAYIAGAQIIKIPMYRNITVNTSTFLTGQSWNESVGGWLLAAASGTITAPGGFRINGTTGLTQSIAGNGSTSDTTGGGYYGGRGNSSGTGTYTSYRGYSGTAAGSAGTSANGSGGGGATNPSSAAGSSAGAGGGYGTSGANGTSPENTNGTGGGTSGASAMTSILFGGGGGGGGSRDTASQTIAAGGSGAGIICLFGRTITAPNSLTATGGTGGDGSRYCDGGGGAGGSILLCGETVDVGTDKLTVVGGAGGSNRGGAGGRGRIAVYYGKSLSGSISASLYGSYTNEQDKSLATGQHRFFAMF